MTTESTQISAKISPETKSRLERFARARGLKKGFLIESALLQHITALESLPAEVIVPARLIVSRASGQQILDLIEHPPEASEALRELLASESAQGGALE